MLPEKMLHTTIPYRNTALYYTVDNILYINRLNSLDNYLKVLGYQDLPAAPPTLKLRVLNFFFFAKKVSKFKWIFSNQKDRERGYCYVQAKSKLLDARRTWEHLTVAQ